MRNAILVFAFLAGVMVSAIVLQQPGQTAYAQTGAMDGAGGKMLMSNVPLAGGGQQIVIIDSDSRSLASYHVKGDTGEIELKSVRNIRWDLQMDVFNGQDPKPQDIRELLNQR